MVVACGRNEPDSSSMKVTVGIARVWEWCGKLSRVASKEVRNDVNYFNISSSVFLLVLPVLALMHVFMFCLQKFLTYMILMTV